MIADLVHEGHIKIIDEAAKYGEVVIGLLTEEACKEINDIPYVSYKSREAVLNAIANVSYIIPQTNGSCIENLKKLGAKIVVHSDDWKTNHLSKNREEVLNYLNSIGGTLIEPSYSKNIGISQIKEQISTLGTTASMRLNMLRHLLRTKKVIKILEVHNPISALIAETITEDDQSFDGMWSSSLTDSTSKGKPDIEAVDTTARLTTINEIFEVTRKPMIYDGDTGGRLEHFPFMVKSLERLGISAVIIEDKCGLKKNSLFGTEVPQEQDSIENFCEKIQAGKQSQITNGFMIIARVESLILGKSVTDALTRAIAYVNAGADGIMIHSKEKDGKEILEFLKKFRDGDTTTPVVVVPTSYNFYTAEELSDAGANIVIYANHMLRSAYPAMVNTAKSILKHGCSKHADETYCMSIKNILELIPGTK
jgi:phosphoenolpyruvate phosphomutase